MHLHTSYSDAFKAAIASQSFAAAHLTQIKHPMNIDTSGCYKLFYFLTGDKKFHIDNFVYDVQPGDLFLVNPREWHYLSHISHAGQHERYVFFFYPDYLKTISTEHSDLTACFHRGTEASACHRLQLSFSDQKVLEALLHKASTDITGQEGYFQENTTQESFGQELLDLGILLELLVKINRLMLSCGPLIESVFPPRDTQPFLSKQVEEVLTYIDLHITEDLSLDHLSSRFFLSGSYLCRIFKNDTGTTIHKYITAKRITLAKDLLSQGYSVTDACNASGFRDYNGFLKSFVAEVGLPPKKYAQFRR